MLLYNGSMRFQKGYRFWMGAGLLSVGLVLGGWELSLHFHQRLLTERLSNLVIEQQTLTLQEQLIQNGTVQLENINPDYVAWISIPQTNLNYPVVQANDNQYYLNHDFSKQVHPFGSIFLDYRNHPSMLSPHTIIYGHAANFDTMFGSLNRYRKLSYLYQHSIIELLVNRRLYRYQIFSVNVVDANVTRVVPTLPKESLANLVQTYQTSSLHPVDLPDVNELALLTLVSCVDDVENGRIMVHALRIP